MNIEEVKRRAELYSALAEGKTIQVKNMDGEWTDVKPEKLNYIPEELVFRIKSEPKYRPFKTQEECWEEMHKHPDFGWTLNKKSKIYENITCVKMTIDMYDKMFSDYTFVDGTPFGIKEE